MSPFKTCIVTPSTRIKLIKKVSAAINVEVGTEQGHPMSPELFKIFINDLSGELDKEPLRTTVPNLDGLRVSHLLWADDLILLPNDVESLQRLLNILGKYIITWGFQEDMD